nr:unnamed protein product [Callosobruchus chinensis]
MYLPSRNRSVNKIRDELILIEANRRITFSTRKLTDKTNTRVLHEYDCLFPLIQAVTRSGLHHSFGLYEVRPGLQVRSLLIVRPDNVKERREGVMKGSKDGEVNIYLYKAQIIPGLGYCSYI